VLPRGQPCIFTNKHRESPESNGFGEWGVFAGQRHELRCPEAAGVQERVMPQERFSPFQRLLPLRIHFLEILSTAAPCKINFTMRFPLSFAAVSYTALALAAPYIPANNIPLHSLYHYCSPPTGPFTPRSTASSLSSTFCNIAASNYHPKNYGEVEIREENGLYLRAWWDASAAKRDMFEDECAEAVNRIIRGCQHEGTKEKFYGGISELARMGGKVEVGFD
jgi:hypothetical protein